MIEGRRVALVSYPEEALPDERHLRLETERVETPGDGEMLLRTIYLSLDPYMRGRMSPARSYAQPVKPGETMVGQTVCEVMESRLDGFAPSDLVLAGLGWRSHGHSDGTGVRKLDPTLAPVSTALGVMGMPGLTAYVGLLDHGRPKAGETVVVSAASGAVGQVVGQIAKRLGCRVVGIAGDQDKLDYVTGELGFDAAVSHRRDDLPEALAEACPDGIDVYFENVGGRVFDAVLPLMNDFGRIPVCGRIANYGGRKDGGALGVAEAMGLTLTRRLTFRGFIIFDHVDRREAFERDMAGWLRDGSVRYREDVVEGLENAVEAFRGLLTGRNRGKLLIRVGEDPTSG